jgi:multidrug efflux pump subunit AcrB
MLRSHGNVDGLLGKNTVLIVEFAIQNAAGKSVLEAAMEGAKKGFVLF